MTFVAPRQCAAPSSAALSRAYVTIACMPPITIKKLIRSRRKTIALVVQPDGSLLVRAPMLTSRSAIDAFVASKSAWIEKAIARQQQREKQAQRYRFVEGEKFYYLGKQYPLRIVPAQKPALVFDLAFSLAQKSLPRARQLFTTWYRQQARLYLGQRVQRLSDLHGYRFRSIRITSARTRWGSCSTRGSLNFSWRIIMLPSEMIDYIILHELAHTIHHNHSPRFWQQVEKTVPDYLVKRKWLRENNHLFSWE